MYQSVACEGPDVLDIINPSGGVRLTDGIQARNDDRQNLTRPDTVGFPEDHLAAPQSPAHAVGYVVDGGRAATAGSHQSATVLPEKNTSDTVSHECV